MHRSIPRIIFAPLWACFVLLAAGHASAQSPDGAPRELTRLPPVENDGAAAEPRLLPIAPGSLKRPQPTVLLASYQDQAPAALAAPPQPAPSMDTRLRELEQLVGQQQTQVDYLQDQLRIATTPPPPPPPEPYKIGSLPKLDWNWNFGPEARSPNRDFYFHVGGRVQWDNVWLNSNDQAAALENTGVNNDAFQQGTFFRRLRIRTEGSMYEIVDWCVEIDFVHQILVQDPTVAAPQIPNGWQSSVGTGIATAQSRMINTPSPTDLWWNIREVPLFGNIQIGNEKEPFSLERLESSRYLDFMERNWGQDAFISPTANGFAPGILAWNWLPSRRGTYAYGLFKNVTDAYAYNVGDGQAEGAGRITLLPWYDEASGGRYFAHIGMGAAIRGIDNGIITYRVRGDLRNGPDILVPTWATTGPIGGQLQNILNPEFLFQYGPLFVQSEFQANWTTNAVAQAGTKGDVAPGEQLGQLFFYSSYVQVMYFLTGEHRIYDYQKGLVGRVIPRSNAFYLRGKDGRIFGPGAWQVGARWNYLNLNDKGVNGGALNAMTFGVNWFLNPNMKIQANYDVTFRDANAATNSPLGGGTEGIIYGFGMRVAADF